MMEYVAVEIERVIKKMIDLEIGTRQFKEENVHSRGGHHPGGHDHQKHHRTTMYAPFLFPSPLLFLGTNWVCSVSLPSFAVF